MQNRRLLDYTPETRTSIWHTYDDDTGETIIEELQDIEPIIEMNYQIQNVEPGGALGLNEYSRKGIKASWWHVARIPAGVQLKWLKELGVDLALFSRDDWTRKRVRQLLSSREWAHLRTGTGKI